MRLMMLFAVNDSKQFIDTETVLKTICFCDWQLKVRKELTPIDADNATAKMEEKVRRQLLINFMAKSQHTITHICKTHKLAHNQFLQKSVMTFHTQLNK